MTRKLLPIGLVAVIAVVAALWWTHSRGHVTASDPATHAGSAAVHRSRTEPAARASAAGRVTRKSDGTAIAGATVTLVRAGVHLPGEGSQAPQLFATTDATGAWTMTSLAPATYIMSAAAPGFLPASHDRVEIAPGENRTGLDVALVAGGTQVHGSVTDVGGGTIAGTRIVAIASTGIAELFGQPAYAVLSGADGRYELWLPDGPYTLTASHDSYTSAHHAVQVAGKPVTADFVLTPGGVIHGQVIAHDTGKPVPGAQVLSVGHGDSSRTATCDGDGNFTLDGLHSGTVAITATGRGYASATPTTVGLGIGEQVEGVRVLVDRAFAIEGKVVRKTDHARGISGVTIGGFSIGNGREAHADEPSADDGAFVIDGVRPGSYILFAIGEHAMPEIGKSVEVVDRDVTGVTVEMAQGAKLSGRVEPPGPATISAALDGDVGLGNMFEAVKAAFVRADTDASGAFVLEQVPSGKLVLSATTRDGTGGKLPVTVTDAEQTGLVITLEPRASIAGQVIDTNHAPVANVHVEAHPLEHHEAINMGEDQGVTTDTDGTFKIVGLEPGKYRVSAGSFLDELSDKTAKDKAKEPELELAKGEARTGVTLTLAARDGVIHGQVIGGDGKPAPDAWITSSLDYHGDGDDPDDFGDVVSGPPVLTDDAGKFTISHLRAGSYKVVAEGARGAARAEKAGVHPGDTVTLSLQPLGTLAGHLTSQGTPVASYDLTCRGPSGSIDRQITAADGSYALEHLAPGPYACDATADTGTAHGKADVPTGPATLELQMVAWASVTGVVVSVLTGEAVSAITAIASSAGTDGRQFASVVTGTAPVTDSTGRFEVDQVADGSGSLMLFAKQGSMEPLANQPYTATAGQRLDLGTIKIIPPRTTDAGTLGLAITPDDKGLAVTSVTAGGPAATAGVVVGDHVVAIDARKIADLTPTIAARLIASGTIGIGVTVALTLDRGVTVSMTSVKW